MKKKPKSRTAQKPGFAALGSTLQLHDYLVAGVEITVGEYGDMAIVKATDREDAIRKFAEKHAIHEDIFIDFVYSQFIYDEFAEMFWLVKPKRRWLYTLKSPFPGYGVEVDKDGGDDAEQQKPEEEFSSRNLETGEEKGPPIVDEETFRKRVTAFFGDRPDFADLYLRYYFNTDESSDLWWDGETDPKIFPKEMLLWIFYNAVNWEETVAVRMDEIK